MEKVRGEGVGGKRAKKMLSTLLLSSFVIFYLVAMAMVVAPLARPC
jgi:hypothetical protein